MVTETVYVTATAPLGESTSSTADLPSFVLNSSPVLPSSSVVAPPPSSSTAYVAPVPLSSAPPTSSSAAYVAPVPLSSAPPASSSAAYDAPVPVPSAPPANGATFTSASKPQPTADSSLLCPHVMDQAKAAGEPIPPMPVGADRDPSVVTYNALPTLAAALCEAPSNFHKLTTTPNQGSIKNSCDYEVYVDSMGCGKGAQHQLIPAGQTWSEPLRSCPPEEGTVVYKVTKADEPAKPVQFEVGLSVNPGQENSVWYDISFLDCMQPNTTDLSACPGWEGGVQCIPGKQGCQVFVCGPGEYCDGSTYTVPEFGIIVAGQYKNDDWRVKAGSPVCSCDTRQEGIAFELCAAN
ncbi:uncharacterized protein N0V89_004678 [Didymosphaeria variabile]|uniref:Uncharacterized protein n=1 Tax=Didymosphaeria variabile TaxID=1932322 RepID=A0A9W8XQZ8_9PLEO|nr:uncharacterized protein N0V89_004678 [Didymosphaeria variabile]KAJ4356642.1 hypothetical protein N0V89_004678 [Didymosphaeria variabile]